MADPVIKIKRSSVAGKIPTTDNLQLGELAINTYDGKVFIEQDQGGVGVGTTIIVVNPWSVGTGTNTYNTYFTAGNVGIGTTNPIESGLSILGKVQIYQDSSSNNRIILRGQPGSSYRWNIDNYSSNNEFRIFREDDATSANGSVAVSISTTGTVTATKFSGDGSLLTGITAAGSGVVVQNQGSAVGTAGTLNFSTNLTASFSSGTATISLSNNPSISGILTADQVYTSNNGNGTNIRIGDDLWIGDINVANTTRFSGAQDSTKAFVVFGTSDTVALGRTGTGPLYYGGNFNVSGVSSATSFSGSGTNLTGIVTSIIAGTNITVSGSTGQVTINASGGGGGGSTTRTTTRSVATENQTSFSVTYSVGYIDVYLNGAKLDSTEYTATNGTSVVLTEGATINDVLEFISYTDVGLSSGTVVIDDTTTNETLYIPYTNAVSGSISSIRVASTELTFNPGTNTFTTGNITGTSLNISGVSTLGTVSNLNVTGVGTVSNLNVTGVGTVATLIPTQTRIKDAAEKITRIDGNTVQINYSSGGGNIGLCTNASGNITLAVTGIPTDSSFDNHSLLFSVFVIQTGTARTCNAVTLNGVSKTIKWPSGTVGSGTTNSYDIFNFIGINTVGSASTTTNYEVLGLVNGGFR